MERRWGPKDRSTWWCPSSWVSWPLVEALKCLKALPIFVPARAFVSWSRSSDCAGASSETARGTPQALCFLFLGGGPRSPTSAFGNRMSAATREQALVMYAGMAGASVFSAGCAHLRGSGEFNSGSPCAPLAVGRILEPCIDMYKLTDYARKRGVLHHTRNGLQRISPGCSPNIASRQPLPHGRCYKCASENVVDCTDSATEWLR